MLSNKSCSALLAAGAIGCVIGAASPASACWCDHRSPSREGVCRVRARVYTYVENPQVFRSELRPKLSYGIDFYCVCIPRSRSNGRSWRGRIGHGKAAGQL